MQGKHSVAQCYYWAGLDRALTALNRGWEQIPVTTATAISRALTSTTEDPPSGVGRVVSGVFNLKLPAKGKASSLGVDGCLFSFLWYAVVINKISQPG